MKSPRLVCFVVGIAGGFFGYVLVRSAAEYYRYAADANLGFLAALGGGVGLAFLSGFLWAGAFEDEE